MKAVKNLSVRDYYQVYLDHHGDIERLLNEIVEILARESRMVDLSEAYDPIMRLRSAYPFVELLYLLNETGIQISGNISLHGGRFVAVNKGLGEDRSDRPYFCPELRNRVVITTPYVSLANRAVCISAAVQRTEDPEKPKTILVLDVDLSRLLDFLRHNGASALNNQPIDP